jgi:hypothetical protein
MPSEKEIDQVREGLHVRDTRVRVGEGREAILSISPIKSNRSGRITKIRVTLKRPARGEGADSSAP